MQTEFTTPFEETSPQELNKRLQKFYLSLRKSDDRGCLVIARQNFVLKYLTVLVYTKTIIHLSVGG